MIKISLSNFGLLINGENKLQILLIFIKIPEHDVSVRNTKKYLFFFFGFGFGFGERILHLAHLPHL